MSLSAERVKQWKKLSDAELKKEITEFNESCMQKFSFDDVEPATKTAVSELLLDRLSMSGEKQLCIAMIRCVRLFARDLRNAGLVLSQRLSEFIIQFAFDLCDKDKFDFDVFVEAEMCLVNALRTCPSTGDVFLSGGNFPVLLRRIELLNKLLPDDEEVGTADRLMLDLSAEDIERVAGYDLKIAFVFTATGRRRNIDYLAADYDLQFSRIVENALKHKELLSKSRGDGDGHLVKCTGDALKTLFNMYSFGSRESAGKVDRSDVIATCAQVIMLDDVMESLEQDAVNVLSCIPHSLLCLVQPNKDCGEDSGNFDVRFLDTMLRAIDRRITEDRIIEGDLLGSYFTVLIFLCTESKEARRYVRMKIMPPLHAEDVQQRPDEGTAFRNKMIRVMMSPLLCRELAAEFLFILCKRNANRLMKYTGLGHAAGLLANYGFLGAINQPRRASDSEESETEDYREVEPRVNPVTGYIEPPHENPLAGMTDEQKEHEAMRLVNAMSELMDRGVITPGTVGEDGRLRPVKHVLELIDTPGSAKARDEDDNSDVE